MQGNYMPDFSNLPGWMPAASMGLGGLSDLFGIIQNQRASNRQRQLFDLLQNPQALAQHVNSMYQPLSAEAQANVARQVQSEMAMRGAADSRYADLASARAFSEIDTQRRNAVMQAYMDALGQSAGLTGQRAPLGGLSNAMQQVMMLRALKGGNPSPGIAANPGGAPSDPVWNGGVNDNPMRFMGGAWPPPENFGPPNPYGMVASNSSRPYYEQD